MLKKRISILFLKTCLLYKLSTNKKEIITVSTINLENITGGTLFEHGLQPNIICMNLGYSIDAVIHR